MRVDSTCISKMTGPPLLTIWKLPFPLKLNSHCIISKKMGMVAFRSSTSGVSVTSRMGPTMDGMNLILWGPEMKVSEDMKKNNFTGSKVLQSSSTGPIRKEKVYVGKSIQKWVTKYCFLITCDVVRDRQVNLHFQTHREINLRILGIKMEKNSLWDACRPGVVCGPVWVIHSPRLYHMSRILKPISFLMSPYLGRRS